MFIFVSKTYVTMWLKKMLLSTNNELNKAKNG